MTCDEVREDGARCSIDGPHEFHMGWVDIPSNVVLWPNGGYTPQVDLGRSHATLSLARRIRKARHE